MSERVQALCRRKKGNREREIECLMGRGIVGYGVAFEIERKRGSGRRRKLECGRSGGWKSSVWNNV